MRNALYLHMLILKTFPEFQIGCAKKDNAITQNKRTRTKTHNTRHRNVLTDREKAQTIASNAPQPKQVTREEEQQLTEDKKPTKYRIEELTESNSCSSNKHQQQPERQRWQEGESVCCGLGYDRRWKIIAGRARHIQRLASISEAEITERQPLLTPHPPRPSNEDQDRPMRIWLTRTPITSNGRSTAEI